MAPAHCLSSASAPPSPPSLPCLYPKLRSGCSRSLRRRSHPPGFTDPGWGAGRGEGVGSGGGGRSRNRETTDGRYPGGSRGLRKKERLEQIVPEEAGASDSAGHLRRPGAWAPQKDSPCGGVRVWGGFPESAEARRGAPRPPGAPSSRGPLLGPLTPLAAVTRDLEGNSSCGSQRFG